MQGGIFCLRDGDELVCRVQTDLGVETPFVLCAPIIARSDWGALVPKLHIPIDFAGDPHVIVMSQMVALPSAQIGAKVGDASDQQDALVAAVDLLVSGF